VQFFHTAGTFDRTWFILHFPVYQHIGLFLKVEARYFQPQQEEAGSSPT